MVFPSRIEFNCPLHHSENHDIDAEVFLSIPSIHAGQQAILSREDR